MTILAISIIIFILILASGYAGLHMQKRLTDEHKTDQSRGVVGQWQDWSAFSWRWFWER